LDQRRLRKTLHKQTDKQTHYENNGHMAVNQNWQRVCFLSTNDCLWQQHPHLYSASQLKVSFHILVIIWNLWLQLAYRHSKHQHEHCQTANSLWKCDCQKRLAGNWLSCHYSRSHNAKLFSNMVFTVLKYGIYYAMFKTKTGSS